MKRYLLIAVCLTATLTAGAVVSAGASASGLPALYECAKLKKDATTKKYEGKYEKGCVKENSKGEGEYEIKEGFGKGKTFKAKGGGANLEVESVGGIDCVKSSATAKFNSPTTGDDVVATFGDCEYSGHKCNSAGATTGTIVTKALKGEVGYLSDAELLSPKVGVAFSPESGEVLAAFVCGPIVFEVTGASIAEVTPVNKFGKEAVFSFRQKRIGVQEWQSFEGGPEQALRVWVCEDCSKPHGESGAYFDADEQLEIKAKTEDLELKA